MRDIESIKKIFDENLEEGDIKFEMASVNKVVELEVYVDRVLEELGCPEALVTDESQIYDFCDVFYEAEDIEKVIEDLEKTLGVRIEDGCEKIVDIAKKLREKEKNDI